MEAYFCSFFEKNEIMSAAHALTVDASSSHMCTDKWLPTASTLCPSVFPAKKAQAVSPSYAQSKAHMNHLQAENFVTIGGCFECYTYHVTALGWLKKEEERKKMNDSDFSPLPL